MSNHATTQFCLKGITPELSDQVARLAGPRRSGEWIKEAILQRIAREDGGLAESVCDLPAAARERVERFAAIIRDAVRDVELAKLEAAWLAEEDPDYYGPRALGVPSTFGACVDAMVGRGGARRTPAAAGCA